MPQDGRDEAQVNGKQLVFLFMAATVSAVVIFLCGVMVGRGVAAQRGERVAPGSAADPTADVGAAPSMPVASSGGASPSSRESLSYPGRLGADSPPPEALKEPEPGSTGEPTAGPVEPARATVVAAAPTAAADSSPEGFAVQVAATRERGEADRMAKRLADKGYSAYVTASSVGARRVFRVRVGKFKDRREAESVATRLEKEEQFKPWITR